MPTYLPPQASLHVDMGRWPTSVSWDLGSVGGLLESFDSLTGIVGSSIFLFFPTDLIVGRCDVWSCGSYLATMRFSPVTMLGKWKNRKMLGPCCYPTELLSQTQVSN